jgi:iron complex transport system substrate-binding protein
MCLFLAPFSALGETEGAAFELYYPEHLKEQFGEKLVMDHIPTRIVVMTTGPVLTMYRMGIDMLAVPASALNEWPDDLTAQQLPLGRNTVDLEGIVMLDPDFVILSTGNSETYGKALEESGVACYYVLSGPGVQYDHIYQEVRLLGEAFGKVEALSDILAEYDALETKIAAYRETLMENTAAILYSEPGANTQGSASYLGDILKRLGYANTADQDTPQGTIPFSMEDLIIANPYTLFVTVPSAPTVELTKEIYESAFQENPQVWNQLDAVKEGRVVYLPAEYSHASGLNIIPEIYGLLDMLR